MEQRRLGDGLAVSAIGLGTLALTGGYGQASSAEGVRTIHTALDAGVSMLDTAPFYGDGAVEELVGRAVRGCRDRVVLATRGGVRSLVAGGPPVLHDARPAALKADCEASLRRLGTDRIDLYYLARVDPQVPIQESVGALAQLVEAGKILHIGVSETDPRQLVAAAAVHPLAALESEYSLLERHLEEAVLPIARELGVGVVAHTPLGKGMLTGSVYLTERDHRRNHPRFQGCNLIGNLELAGLAAAVAERAGLSLTQAALAWLMARGSDIVPIPSTRTPAHLEENLGAMRIRLNSAHTQELEAVFTSDAVLGSRNREPVPDRISGARSLSGAARRLSSTPPPTRPASPGGSTP
jgi:aryl-alcohol dehydrogenase-like predicted oxidoreductase